VYWLLSIAAFLTAFYMGRQILMVFFGEPRSPAAEHAEESPPVMTVPLIILAVLSVLGGALNLPVVHTFGRWLEHTIQVTEATGGFNLTVALISTALALVAIAFSWWLYDRRYKEILLLPTARRPDDPLRAILGPIFTGMEKKWWVDELYRAVVLNPYIALSHFLADVVDGRFWHDWFHDTVIAGGYNLLSQLLSVRVDLGVIDAIANRIAQATQNLAAQMRRIQTGFVRNYALSVFIGAILILGYLILR
jgi:NADH-quinone oxidoreductase subunit L